jgi:AcrR family transcriptional regulator/DNA-binding MarR family transcriptional regulator
LRGAAPRVQLTEIQRSRLLLGAVGAIEEHGYAGTTVAHITARAKVSRRTFYELFEDREACVVTLIEDVLGLLEDELGRAGLEGLPWLERVRGGLVAILGFFDREPALARMCVVQALSSGPRMLERRQAILARLAGVLDEGRNESPRGAHCTALTAEGLVGAAFGIVHARLLRSDGEALLGLAGELMGMIALPYMGPAAARRELAAPLPEVPAPAQSTRSMVQAASSEDPLEGLRMRWTYRTARVMQGISELPGASNRAVADYAGIQDQGQVSKLLARLQRLGLVANTTGGQRGEPNAWSLTPLGEQVAQRLHMNIPVLGEQAA